MIWRVRDRAELAALARVRPVRRGPVTLRYLPNGEGGARVAYAIGKSVGPAVTRNRVRRRLRAAVHDLRASLRPGVYLLGADPAAAVIPFADLRQAIADAAETAAGPR